MAASTTGPQNRRSDAPRTRAIGPATLIAAADSAVDAADRRADRRHPDLAFLDVLRPASPGDQLQLVPQRLLAGDRVRRHRHRLPLLAAGRPASAAAARPAAPCRCWWRGGQPVPHPAEDPQRMRAVQPLDVHRLEPVEHRDLDGLPGPLAQADQRGHGRLVQVNVGCHHGAELVDAQAEPVPAGDGVALEQPLLGQRGKQPVYRALAETQPGRQFGHAKLLVHPRELLEQPGGVADR